MVQRLLTGNDKTCPGVSVCFPGVSVCCPGASVCCPGVSWCVLQQTASSLVMQVLVDGQRLESPEF